MRHPGDRFGVVVRKKAIQGCLRPGSEPAIVRCMDSCGDIEEADSRWRERRRRPWACRRRSRVCSPSEDFSSLKQPITSPEPGHRSAYAACRRETSRRPVRHRAVPAHRHTRSAGRRARRRYRDWRRQRAACASGGELSAIRDSRPAASRFIVEKPCANNAFAPCLERGEMSHQDRRIAANRGPGRDGTPVASARAIRVRVTSPEVAIAS